MQHRRQAAHEAGGATLAATLAVTTAMLALAAALAVTSASTLAVARSLRSARAATYRAEACIQATVARIPPGRLLSVPAASEVIELPGCTVAISAAPPDARGSPRLHLLATGVAGGGGRREVIAIVGRSRAPYLPALLQLPRAASLVLDGHLVVDRGGPSRLAALAAPDPDTVAALRAALAAAGNVVEAAPGPGPARVIEAPALPLDRLAARLVAAGAREHPPGAVRRAVWGGARAPELGIVEGDLVVRGKLQGAGMLLVEGTLDIEGLLDFTGMVIARGGMAVARRGRAAVAGGLIVGSARAGTGVELRGELRIARSDTAIETLDARFPLPRRAVRVAQRDAG